MPATRQLGNTGEAVARAHLERLGWRILATNFRCRQGEMDIIASETENGSETLVFVEVKTRRGKAHGSPIEAVNERKRQKLIVVAQAYLADRNAGGEEPACRFDVAEVFFGPDGLATVQMHRAFFGA
jgi:putative endonuclease